MIAHYRRMLDDPVRVAAFHRAIATTVGAGDVVVDLGCAFANYAVAACRAGASRVYAVDSGAILVAARGVAAANACDDRIRFLRGRSTELEVPEPADVVVFEDYPISLLSPDAARTNNDAVSRWLKPGGRLIPGRARLLAAPVESADTFRELDCFAESDQSVAGVDVRPTRHLAFSEPRPVHLDAGSLLGDPSLVADVALRPMDEPVLRHSSRAVCLRRGTLHGVLLWFEMELAGEWLSSGPLSPPVAWRQTLFPLETPLAVEAGDPIGLSLRGGPFGDEMVWQWRVETPRGSWEATNFDAMGLDSAHLARWDPDETPVRDREHALELSVLQLMDGRRTLGEIAERVTAGHGARFARPEDLQRRILAVVRRERGGRERSP